MYGELYLTRWATEAQGKVQVASQCCHLEAGPEGRNPGTPIPGPDLGPLSFAADSPSPPADPAGHLHYQGTYGKRHGERQGTCAGPGGRENSGAVSVSSRRE